MKLKYLPLALTMALSTSNVYALSINEFVDSSLEASPKIKALQSAHEADLEAIKEQENFYHPSLKYELDNKINVENRSEARDSTLTLRSNILQGNRSDILDSLHSKADISKLAIETEASNMRAQIMSSVYKVALYEHLIKEGERIIDRANKINADISNKVDGGLAKTSDSTTSMVLLKEMESSILAIKLKIDQLKIDLEKTTGRPYPTDLEVELKEIVSFMAQHPVLSVDKNKSLMKKQLEAKVARFNLDAADNWYKLDAYAKSEFQEYNFSNANTEVGLQLTIDLVNPSNYWKERQNVHRYDSERYMLEQMTRDTQLGLEAQMNILNSNKALWDSLVESLDYKKSLIKERGDEYEINLTSLYELIQSWSSYYATVQQKTDTEATLVDTMISVQVMTGEL
ncbi:TolC family protein [Vibrio sp. D431a]|uniref:TolC family protein n=1 Tax=Vibrio sp. D431a TaxID=2837388 RepID=UPI002554B77E|nr:TolC family protein [Vibrio sp. D431a]MDK9790737.1 TolC family protein [Vibrio sp. D431a]